MEAVNGTPHPDQPMAQPQLSRYITTYHYSNWGALGLLRKKIIHRNNRVNLHQSTPILLGFEGKQKRKGGKPHSPPGTVSHLLVTKEKGLCEHHQMH